MSQVWPAAHQDRANSGEGVCALKLDGIVDVDRAWQSVLGMEWVGVHRSCAKPFTAHACVPRTHPLGMGLSSDVLEEVCFCILQTGDVPWHMLHEVASVVACVPYCSS